MLGPCLSQTLHCLPSSGFELRCHAAEMAVVLGLPKKVKGQMRVVED
jgi:hypothetical protein